MQVSRELCGRTESKYFILCRGWMQYFVWMVAVGPENNQYYEKGPDASLKVVERQGKEC
jgi:hypothetical protein